MNDWQPIETAPRDRRILLANTKFVCAGQWLRHWDGDGFTFDGAVKANQWITHWMPLPEPPE